ncbi:collagenase-like [Hyposmocoma kahamanoa]|uniref:collagenase-like n=1 Tax=Hyposmocoma kahamanoa TaxID=1477025 RepID=UPI000E6D6021|nr:collagenase-like [Hyposmocoma kahamanoa]
MKWIIFVCLFALALSKPAYEPINLFYHERVGIPKAAAIKRSEESSDFSGSRIVGGTPATLSDSPWFAGLILYMRSGATSVCGSSLLSNTRILTAAHCWWDGRSAAREAVIVLGSLTLFTGGVRRGTAFAEMYPGYDPRTLHNDIAVLSIGFIGFNNDIRPIGLPSGPDLDNDFFGAVAQISGYGRHGDLYGLPTDQRLHVVNLTVIANEYCQVFFAPSVVVPSRLCTLDTRRGTCGGDDGGALVTRNMVIGVASFTSVAGCDRNFPVGFSRVTSFVSWINAQL